MLQHSVNQLRALLGSETRARVLETLALHPGSAYHLRGLAAAAGVDSGNAHKTLQNLLEAGLIEKMPDARGPTYRLDARSPLAKPVRQLALAASALIHDLTTVADKLAADQVLVYGSMAKGTDGPDSDIDILVIGDVSPIDAQAAFAGVSRRHRRQIDVKAVERRLMEKELTKGSQFWRDIVQGEVIMLKGEDFHASIGARSRA